MRLRFVLAATGLLAVLGPAQVATKPAGQDAQKRTAPASRPSLPYKIGDRIDPALALSDLDGKVHRIKDYAGKIVVLDFWSIACPISRGYESKLIAIHEDYRDKDVVVLALDANNREVDRRGKRPFARIRRYCKRAHVPYPVLIDRDSKVADMFNARTTPHLFILDRQGRLAYRGGIDDDFQWRLSSREKPVTEHARAALDDLVAGKKVRTADTRAWGCTIKRPRKARKNARRRRRVDR